MIPRWKIKFKCSNGSVSEIKIYNADKQKLYDRWSKDFEVVSIEQDTDVSHVRFIEQIKSNKKGMPYGLPFLSNQIFSLQMIQSARSLQILRSF